MTGRAALGLLAGCLATPAAAQSVSVAASRWLTTPQVTDYRLSVSSYRAGPISLLPFAQLTVQGPRASGATLAGVGGDVLLQLPGDAGLYLVGGVSGGIFDFRRSLGLDLWSAWSAGVGAELLQVAGIGLGVEGRYQRLSRERTGGISIGARLGRSLRSRSPAMPVDLVTGTALPPPPEDGPTARPGPPVATGASAAARTVLEAALEAMGTPYRWGGSDANGFDCSGLIQYAYARAGVAVPRRSVDQAGFGRAVGTDPARLSAGDILVFGASPGDRRPSHVGLYLGEGRFIHSATGGTMISALAPGDATGRWWHDRWIGARRIID